MSKKVLYYYTQGNWEGCKLKKLRYLYITILLSMLLLACQYVSAAEYRSEISVGIKYGQNSGNSFTVSSANGVNVYDAVSGVLLYTASSSESVYVEMGSTGFASWNKFDASGRSKISLQPINGGTIFCDGVEYRGYIYAERRSNGQLLIINYVGIDDYVSSVLGKEMSYTWPMEALKAQSVCARNFVLTRGSTHREYGFDVCPSTHCQVYGGVKSEHPNTRRAVEETSGVIATYKGELVGLYFFATSGGVTEDVENVWGGKYGYLRSVDDPYENPDKASRYTWNVTYTKAQIEEKLANAGVNIGELKSITINSVSDSGRVLEMTFNGTSGSHTVKREKCRTILSLYSQKFTIQGEGSSSVITTSGVAPGTLYAISSYGVTSECGNTAISGNGTISNVNSGLITADSYVIYGGGYGHGVGMSQWGARGMAENGFTYDQILHHYFTDIVLE